MIPNGWLNWTIRLQSVEWNKIEVHYFQTNLDWIMGTVFGEFWKPHDLNGWGENRLTSCFGILLSLPSGGSHSGMRPDKLENGHQWFWSENHTQYGQEVWWWKGWKGLVYIKAKCVGVQQPTKIWSFRRCRTVGLAVGWLFELVERLPFTSFYQGRALLGGAGAHSTSPGVLFGGSSAKSLRFCPDQGIP